MRACAVIEGKEAVQAVSRAVSHTTGLTNALSNTPDEKTEQSKLMTGDVSCLDVCSCLQFS